MAGFVIRTAFRVYNPASYGAKPRKTDQADEKWGAQSRSVGIAGSLFACPSEDAEPVGG